jgi:hypothetical protein
MNLLQYKNKAAINKRLAKKLYCCLIEYFYIVVRLVVVEKNALRNQLIRKAPFVVRNFEALTRKRNYNEI